VRTEDLIVQLARAAGPVPPLANPLVRLARWTATVVPLLALAVLLAGPRADVLTAIRQPSFIALAVVTFATALLSAAGAFVLSVPGAERSPVHRTIPLLAAGTWALWSIARLIEGGDPVRSLLSLPIHSLCVIEIAGLGVIPGWALFSMLRRAAPLRLAWSAALATLAAGALGAAATQILCPLDDPAHHLVGHLLPVMLFAGAGTIAGRRSLDWLHS
jgi:hypothetical protein